MNDGVCDVNLRRILIESKGYCRRHAEYWFRAGHALDRAILYQDQVRIFLDFIESGAVLRRNSGRVWDRHAPCPACAAEADAGRRFLLTLFENFNDPDLHHVLSASGGFCVRHFLQATDAAPNDSIRIELIDLQRRRTQGLLQELESFCRKLSQRLPARDFGSEQDAWRRAVELMAGIPAVQAAPPPPAGRPVKKSKPPAIKRIHRLE